MQCSSEKREVEAVATMILERGFQHIPERGQWIPATGIRKAGSKREHETRNDWSAEAIREIENALASMDT
ncbi:hypothetical protein AMTR_s00021p00015930 [Amborella trichopoda]|uniref:Uncharacterized protein n=1 Tax=Amborella trichopoda TaxID=13333 RepID=W1PZM9_AMBTC|nr:hypothetical protein AMTR_s00021p00015930 [Amborella trichopoda]